MSVLFRILLKIMGFVATIFIFLERYSLLFLRQSIPQEVIDSHELQTITLDYRRECQQDDVVDSLTNVEHVENAEAILGQKGTNGSTAATENQNNNRQFLHLLRISGDGSEINRGRTVWRKKPAR